MVSNQLTPRAEPEDRAKDKVVIDHKNTMEVESIIRLSSYSKNKYT